MSSRLLEEGSGADDSVQLVQRHPTQRRPLVTTARAGTARTQPEALPPHAPASSNTHPLLLPPSSSSSSSSSSSRLSLLSSPYFALLVTVALFLIVLSASAYVFLRLQRQHPDHLFTSALSSTVLSPLLSEHPAYQQLQRELTGQYQQMLTIAKRYMSEEQWQEFQAEAVRIDSGAALRALQQQPAAAVGDSCPPCPVCSTSAATSDTTSRLSELMGQPVMTDW